MIAVTRYQSAPVPLKAPAGFSSCASVTYLTLHALGGGSEMKVIYLMLLAERSYMKIESKQLREVSPYKCTRNQRDDENAIVAVAV